MASSRKPYNRWEGPRTFFRTPSRHLKESNAKESSFEKPYLTSLYTEMHQEPNFPAAPKVGVGKGGLSISFIDGACGYGVSAVAGYDIKTIGGPEEDKAGFLPPEVKDGAIVSWEVLGEGRRQKIVLDESVAGTSLVITFKDGWGQLWTSDIRVSCGASFEAPILVGAIPSTTRLFRAVAAEDQTVHAVGYKAGGSGGASYPVFYYKSTNGGTNWSEEMVYDPGGAALEVLQGAICLDSGGDPHIFFCDESDNLLHAYKSAGVWTTEHANPSISGPFNTIQVEIDGSDNFHVAASVPSDGSFSYLVYFYGSVGSWSQEIVQAVAHPDSCNYCDIALNGGDVGACGVNVDDGTGNYSFHFFRREWLLYYPERGDPYYVWFWTKEDIATGLTLADLGTNMLQVVGSDWIVYYSYKEAATVYLKRADRTAADTFSITSIYTAADYSAVDIFDVWQNSFGEELLVGSYSPFWATSYPSVYGNNTGSWKQTNGSQTYTSGWPVSLFHTVNQLLRIFYKSTQTYKIEDYFG